MQFYRITRYVGETDPGWAATLSAAHDMLRKHPTFQDARIELFDIPTDKEGVLALLSRAEGLTATVLRTWALTPRGGLKEVENGE